MTDEEALDVIDSQINGLAERLHFGNPHIQGHGYNTLHGCLVDMLVVLEMMRDYLRGRYDGQKKPRSLSPRNL